MRSNLKQQRGFTLNELLICIVGIGTLAVVVAIVCIAAHFIAKFW